LKKENARVYKSKELAKNAIYYLVSRYSHIRKINLEIEEV